MYEDESRKCEREQNVVVFNEHANGEAGTCCNSRYDKISKTNLSRDDCANEMIKANSSGNHHDDFRLIAAAEHERIDHIKHDQCRG